ncbi:hypothetical protein ILUMI_20595 [Ignelater luminosus]|uniref:PiggyBac transposable element-derived protein domain-containing protein n=1 Tax=Ignelater luminosus TaxID=2038154 RepID=A0A8K0CHX3_IGNLU|nr:hypothetical protein ILUMI_20595 [Ignelater luminosus]
MSYEAEQDHLLRLLREVEEEGVNPIDEESDPEVDNSQRDNFSKPRDAKSTDLVEIKALLGPLYLAGVLRSGRFNVDDLWEKNSTSVEKFWLTMSKERFLFLLRLLCFDDKIMRNERKFEDKLTVKSATRLVHLQRLMNSCWHLGVGAHSGNTSL